MDVSSTRILVVSLAGLCALSLVGSTVLTAIGVQPPPALGAIIGTTFGVLIGIPIVPKGRGGAQTPRHPSRNAGESRGLILAIDDSEGVRLTIENLLGDAGYEVRTASTGEEGLGLIRSGLRPDLILLDMILPGMDGNGFLTELKGDFPVVVLSAWPDHLEPVHAERVSLAVRKPPSAGELVQVVESALSKRSA